MTEPPRDASSDDPAPVRRLAHPPEQKPIFSQDTRAWQIADQLATCLLYGKDTSDLATWERHRLKCLCRASGLDDQDADHLRRIACRMTRDDREIGYLFSRALESANAIHAPWSGVMELGGGTPDHALYRLWSETISQDIEALKRSILGFAADYLLLWRPVLAGPAVSRETLHALGLPNRDPDWDEPW